VPPLDGVSLRLGGMACFRAMTTLANTLVPDKLWAIVAPLLPPAPRPWWGGRARIIPDRACFAAIVFMARTSTPWRLLPAAELGCGSYSTVRRRLDHWLAVGVFERLHDQVLDRLGTAGVVDWTRASVDTMTMRARRGGTILVPIRSTAASQGPSCTW
jgi:transposase